ncbi:hypothetical protein [uncultured Pontibacter sp.]|uniref:hypothetical protein n=1 Tax=uncultured Pontibacter sp. TaxID=453356 RepID=UPI002621B33F|nr:hypothetical protein [uncultured Pontibacter sp.]
MNHYKDNYCHISYLPDTNQIYLKWHLPPCESKLIQCYDKGFEMAIKNQAVSWVTDNSIGFQPDLSMQRALAQLAASRMKHTSLKRFARVTPMDVFQELLTHKILNQINDLTVNTVEYEVFHNPKDAQVWCAQLNLLSVN